MDWLILAWLFVSLTPVAFVTMCCCTSGVSNCITACSPTSPTSVTVTLAGVIDSGNGTVPCTTCADYNTSYTWSVPVTCSTQTNFFGPCNGGSGSDPQDFVSASWSLSGSNTRETSVLEIKAISGTSTTQINWTRVIGVAPQPCVHSPATLTYSTTTTSPVGFTVCDSDGSSATIETS